MPQSTTIDLNADLGESYGHWKLGNDTALLNIVTSANIACGFHAGDPTTLLTTLTNAAHHGISIGAQVSYNDLPGFGRRFIDVPPTDLKADILYQISALDGLARTAGTHLSYVKPHGALYNAIVHHEPQARAVIDALTAYPTPLPLLTLPGSIANHIAQTEGITTYHEAFADRAYTNEGTLVPRTHPHALLHDPHHIAERITQLATTGTITSIDGTDIHINPHSICIHGDTPNAVTIATHIRTHLEQAGITLQPFTTTHP